MEEIKFNLETLSENPFISMEQLKKQKKDLCMIALINQLDSLLIQEIILFSSSYLAIQISQN